MTPKFPRPVPEDCPVYKQVLNVAEHLGIEPTEEFKHHLLIFAHQCAISVYNRAQELKTPPLILYDPKTGKFEMILK